MRTCPRCTYPLTLTRAGSVDVDVCGRCRGVFLDPGETGAVFGHLADPSQWGTAMGAAAQSPLACPDGHGPMWTYRVAFGGDAVDVDACGVCRSLWLDAGEGEKLYQISARARAAAAPLPDMSAPGSADADGAALAQPPGAASYIFQLLTGMPIEVWNPVKKRPVMLYGLLGVLTAVFAYQLAMQINSPIDDHVFVDSLGLFPADVLHGERLYTLVTHAFLHAGVAHFLGNVYFLYIFGDNVEDRLGRAKFVVLYVVSLFVAAAVYIAGNPTSVQPMIGASGAISGVMAAYIVLFPRVRLWVVLFFVRFKVPAVGYMLVWVALNVMLWLAGAGGVAWLAHIGGFAAGLGMAALFRAIEPKTQPATA